MNELAANPTGGSTAKFQFLFSTLVTPPKFVFQFSGEVATHYISETHEDRVSIPISHTKSQDLQIEHIKRDYLSLNYCDMLVTELLKEQSLIAFRTKVNTDQYPTYLTVIKHPMDLKTLLERLRSGQIISVPQFKYELDLIWDNCLTFNGPQEPLSIQATRAKSIIDEVWSQCDVQNPSHAIDSLKQIRDVLGELHKEALQIIRLPDEKLQIPPPKKPPKKAPKPQPQQVVQVPKIIEGPPNPQQRKLIADKLSNSPVTDMRKAWDIIRPYLNKDDIGERPYISLNNLPADVLIELKKVVLA